MPHPVDSESESQVTETLAWIDAHTTHFKKKRAGRAMCVSLLATISLMQNVQCGKSVHPMCTLEPWMAVFINSTIMSSFLNYEGEVRVDSDKCQYTEDAIISDYT